MYPILFKAIELLVFSYNQIVDILLLRKKDYEKNKKSVLYDVALCGAILAASSTKWRL